jgi:hypothetical protein
VKKPYAKDRILARVAELGYWPPKKQLAEEIGCSPITVTEARRWAERQTEEARLKNLKEPCPYCQRHEKAEALHACGDCSQFLTDAFGLARMTLFLRNNVHHRLEPEELNRAKMALAAIVEEWVTDRARIEVWGDQEGRRWNNSWFYEGNQEALGAGTDVGVDEDDDEDDQHEG